MKALRRAKRTAMVDFDNADDNSKSTVVCSAITRKPAESAYFDARWVNRESNATRRLMYGMGLLAAVALIVVAIAFLSLAV